MKNMKIPFNEVDFQLSNNQLEISAPWVSIEASIESKILKDYFLSEKGNYENAEFQTLLNELDEYIISYDLPRTTLLPSIDFHKTEISPTEEEYKILSICEGKKQSYDPITLFQQLSKKSLVYQHECEKTHNVYSSLKKALEKSNDFFKEALVLLLNQTYFITSNFSKVVTPNKKHVEELSYFVEKIYQEEVGHHKLILQSLNALGETPDIKKVFQSTKNIMDIVSEGLEHSALGFAVLNNNLEGSHYPDSDPLSEIIKASPYKDAAKGLDAHFNINLQSNHKDIGLEIVSSLRHYICQNEALYAIVILERLKKSIHEMDVELINFIGEI